MYTALCNVGCRVVWGLPTKYMEYFDEDPTKNPKFIIKAW